MATTSFFYGGGPGPDQTTINELVEELNNKLAEAQAIVVAAQAAYDAVAAASGVASEAAAQALAYLGQTQEALAQTIVARDAAIAAQNAAASSAVSSASSATASANSATNSANSASASAASASAASTSASNAATSASNAASSASAASASASNAASSASNAASSASAALAAQEAAEDAQDAAEAVLSDPGFVLVANDLAGPDTIGTVADNIAHVQIVAGISADVSTVANISEAIPAVVDNAADIDTVAANIGVVQIVGSDLGGSGWNYDLGSITDPDTGQSATPDGYIVSVYNNLDDITTVAGIDDDVTAVANIVSNVSAVANITADVSTVAGIDTEVVAVAGVDTEIVALYAQLPTIAEKVNKPTTLPVGNGNVVLFDGTDGLKIKDGGALGTAAFTPTTDYATAAQGANADTAYGWGNHALAGYLTSETDSQTLSWNGSTGELSITNGNTVDLDGRYLQSFTESDPVFVASPSYNITNTKISNWDTAYGWGNHASAGYALTSSLGSLATKNTVGTNDIDNNAVTVDKLAATLDLGSIA
jgi:hypothetical protein